jgi:hypothetical protein
MHPGGWRDKQHCPRTPAMVGGDDNRTNGGSWLEERAWWERHQSRTCTRCMDLGLPSLRGQGTERVLGDAAPPPRWAGAGCTTDGWSRRVSGRGREWNRIMDYNIDKNRPVFVKTNKIGLLLHRKPVLWFKISEKWNSLKKWKTEKLSDKLKKPNNKLENWPVYCFPFKIWIINKKSVSKSENPSNKLEKSLDFQSPPPISNFDFFPKNWPVFSETGDNQFSNPYRYCNIWMEWIKGCARWWYIVVFDVGEAKLWRKDPDCTVAG